MRLRHLGIVALAFMLGCVRFGYDALRAPAGQSSDAGHIDAGTTRVVDAAAVADAESPQDASGLDAAMPAVSAADAAMHAAGADAASAEDTGVPNDAAMQGSTDSGPADGGASFTGPCAVSVTTNSYVGSPHYHGTLSLKNAGTTIWTTPTIAFDLPSTNYVCNDANVLPGAGWTLQTSGNHCTYTKTSPNLSVAPGATLDFEYSSNNTMSVSASAATNLSVLGCP